MKNIFIILFLVIVSKVSAQVGINTTDPQQTVHLSGSTANVRVDGLNETNNNKNLGTDSTTRVFVDAEGDLILGTSGNNVEILVDSSDYLVNTEDNGNIIHQTGTGFGYNTAGVPNNFPGDAFTLTGNAILEVNYSVSWSAYKTGGANGRIADKHARIIQTALYFRRVTNPADPYAGPAVVYDIEEKAINGGPWCIQANSGGCQETGGLIALNGQFYTNTHKSNGSYRGYRNTGTDYVKLGPGTYVALFAGQMAVRDVSGTGAVKMYLGSANDELQIIAYYYE